VEHWENHLQKNISTCVEQEKTIAEELVWESIGGFA
jgi:hypothetical protein